MSGLAGNMVDMVGNTPMVRLNSIANGCKAEVIVKAEGYNPLLSVKDQVTIPQGGRIEADVEAGSVEISGVIEGNVAVSDKIEIKSGGLLVGDVKAARVLIADGATFKGNINQ